MKYIVFFLFVTSTVFGQNNLTKNNDTNETITATAENFNKYYNLKKQSSTSLNNLVELCMQYRLVSEDTTRLLGERALKWTKQKADNTLYANALMNLGYAYGLFGDYDEATEMMQRAKAIYENENDTKKLIQCNTKIGYLAINKGNFETALDYFLNVISDSEKQPLKEQSVEPYLNLGWIYFNLNDFGKLQEYLIEATNLAEKLNNDESWMLVSEKQATLYMYIGEGYMNQAAADSTNRKLYQDSSDFFIKKSFEAFDKSISIAQKLGDKGSELSALNNKTVLNLKLGLYPNALKVAKVAENISKEFGDVELMTQCKYNLIYVYMALEQYDLATKYGEDALTLAKKYDLKRKKALINAALYELYLTTGNHKKALENLEQRYYYDKEIGDAERNKALAEVEAKFQNVKKQKQILELKQSNEAITRQRNLILTGLLIMSIFGFGVFQFIKVRRERNDKKAFAEALIFAQEEERKRIARDLHDSVGQSLLLLKKQMVLNHETTLENQTMISETLDEVRAISRDLHPLQLEALGLTAAIEGVVQKVKNSTDLFITTDIENIDTAFSNNTNIHVFRVIQETLNNIVKHAKATATKIVIQKKDSEILILIMDNGKGFDHELAIVKSKSLGLKTMHERIALVGGKMKITPNEPSGTIVTFNIKR